LAVENHQHSFDVAALPQHQTKKKFFHAAAGEKSLVI
jgi:hypothetical protein